MGPGPPAPAAPQWGQFPGPGPCGVYVFLYMLWYVIMYWYILVHQVYIPGFLIIIVKSPGSVFCIRSSGHGGEEMTPAAPSLLELFFEDLFDLLARSG